MEAEIIDEDDQGIGVRVIDNSDVNHTVAVGFDGEVQGHSQNGYPDDPSERTSEESKHVSQARRFAQYYVYRRRGHETIDPYSERDNIANPDRLAAATLILAAMSDEAFEASFRDYYRQLMSYHTDEESVITLPAEAADAPVVRIEQDVYLALELSDYHELLAYLDEVKALTALEEALDTPPETPSPTDEGLFERLQSVLSRHRSESDLERYAEKLSTLYVDEISPLRVHWQRGGREYVEYGPGTELDRDRGPDARLQLVASQWEIADLTEFRRYLIHHLRCQLRDCYIGLGVQPPEDARLQGPGIFDYAVWYEQHEAFQPYHDQTATIDWDQLSSDPVVDESV